MSNSTCPTPSSDSSSSPESDASPTSERLRLEVDVLKGARLGAPPEEEASAPSDAFPAPDTSPDDGSIDDEGASSPDSGALGVLLVLVLSLACMVGGTVPAHAQIFVDADATGENDGSSWSDAYTSLRDALATATGTDEIWIAEGTYTPGTIRGASYKVTGSKDGLEIYGGFAGTESSRADRDISTHETILSGDIGTPGDASDNSYHVLIFQGITGDPDGRITPETVLDGVTVREGNANRSSFPGYVGGGLYCDGSGADNACSPTLSNITFVDNTASIGGAIYNDAASFGESSPQIINATFIGNTCKDLSLVALDDSGGAIYNGGTNDGVSSPRIVNTMFMANTAGLDGGAIHNDAEHDGTSRPEIISSAFIGNDAGLEGGAISSQSVDGGTTDVQITNSTFVGNTAYNGGGLANYTGTGTSTVQITNTIVWGNSPNQMENDKTSPTVSHSLIEGGLNGPGVEGASNIDGGGNVSGDPAFLDANGPDNTIGTADDDLHLIVGSPALDAGDDAALPSDVTTDLTGDARIQNGTVDLGAFEGGKIPPLIVNSTEDGDDGDLTPGDLSLREVIARVESGATVSFDGSLSGQTIALTSGQLTLDKSLTIDASGLADGITISGDNSSRVFEVTSDEDVTLRHLTIADGSASSSAGILNEGTLTLDGVTVTGNTATSKFGVGGGLLNRVSADLTLQNSTVSGNSVPNGDGTGGGLHNSGAAVLTNSTFFGNSAGATAGGIMNSGTLTLRSSVIANSTEGDCVQGGTGTVTEERSLVEDGSCGATLAGDPLLGALADNGGPTQTHLPDPTSSLLDAGTCNSLSEDQRTLPRPVDLPQLEEASDGCDIGAVEVTTDEAPDPQETFYVDGATGSDGNDGKSWGQAFVTLAKALVEATGNDQIWIRAGTYTPTAGTDRTGSFTVTGEDDGLKIYGGFAGTESTLDERDLSANETILSGDIGTRGDASDNSYHVVEFDGTTEGPITSATVLSDVTVTAGNADGPSPDNRGGGLYCVGNGSGNECSPTIRNVVFAENAAAAGGAIYNFGEGGTSSPQITNVVFAGNTATLFGGAILNNGNNGGTSSPQITNATFSGNTADDKGGALYNSGSSGTSAPTLTNAVLYGNTASNGGDEVYNLSATPTIAHSLVQGSGGSGSWNTSFGTDGGNNIDADPQFVNESDPDGADDTFATGNDGLLVGPSSPTVDAGDNSAIQSGITTDLLGTTRTQDGDGDGTATGSLGAYETLGNPTTTSLSIDGTDGTGNDRGWRLLGVPYASTTAGALRLTHANGTTTPRLDIGVVALWDDSTAPDQDGDPTGGFFRADASTPLSAGQGFLLFLLDDDTAPVDGEDGLTLSVEDDGAALQPPEPVDVDLTASARWHLVANPHPTSYRLNALTVGVQSLPTSGFQADVQIYDAPTQTWQLKDASATDRAAPWQGFFLERSTPGSGPTTVTFEPRGRTQGAPFVGSKSEAAGALASAKRGEIGLRVTATRSASDTTVLARDDAAALRFHERATPGFDAYDASKLDPLADTFVTLAPVGPARGDSLTAKAIESRPWFADTTRSNSSGTDPAVIPLRLRSEGLPEDAALAVSPRTWTLPEGWTAALTDMRGTRRTGDDRQVALTAGTVYETTRRPTAADTARFVVSVRRSDAALPVELSEFDARMDDGAVRLAWETASETGNAGFQIQRKGEGKNGKEGAWARIGFVEGAGTTDAPQSYTFADTGVPCSAEHLTYRLRQVDTDGTATLHDPVTVTRAAPDQVQLQDAFPNPVRSRATIRYTLPRATDVHLAVYDVLGRRVQTLVDEEQPAGRKHLTLDSRQLSELASGTYFYRLTAGETTRTRKLTILR